jgi:hypothetical protein
LVQEFMTRPPTRIEVLVAVVYLVTVATLTGLMLISPSTYAYYWVRFLILLPSSFVVLYLDYFVGVLLFGPNNSTWLSIVYTMGVAIAAGAMQLFVAWTIRKRAK